MPDSQHPFNHLGLILVDGAKWLPLFSWAPSAVIIVDFHHHFAIILIWNKTIEVLGVKIIFFVVLNAKTGFKTLWCTAASAGK